MKTKNCRVRVKDVKAGAVFYRSHPVFGIEEIHILGRPAMVQGIGLFAPAEGRREGFSLDDAGVTPGESSNYRRTFFKRKHAEEWARKMRDDPQFQAHHEEHLFRCGMFRRPTGKVPELGRGYGGWRTCPVLKDPYSHVVNFNAPA